MKDQPTNKEIEKVADKVIPCDACAWLKLKIGETRKLNNKIVVRVLTINKYTPEPEELKHINAAQKANFKILPGTPYIEEHGVFKGKPYVSRYIKEIHQICLKYGLYSYAEPKKGPLKSRGSNLTPKKKKRNR